MRTLVRSIIAMCIIAMPFTAMAHGYWIETEGPHKAKKAVTIKLYYGDYPAGERLNGKFLDRMKDIKVFVSVPGKDKQLVEMKQANDYWEGTFTPPSSGMYEITGINDEREVQDWTKHNLGITRPVQYLKAWYAVGSTDVKEHTSLFIDVTVTKAAFNNYNIIVVKDGNPLASQKVVLSSYGADEKEVTTDENGKATVSLDKDGLYILSIDWIDNTPGKFKDKDYETVRHRLDYSLYK